MKKYLILFISISLMLISCSDLDDFSGLTFDQNTFDTNQKLWTENKELNYTFSQEYFSNSVGNQPKLTSVIMNSELDTIFVQSEYKTNISIENFIYYETIDEVYDFIERIANSCEEQINSSEGLMKGAEINVEYDDTFYYPTKISCYGYYPDGYMGGLSTRIIFSNFKANQ